MLEDTLGIVIDTGSENTKAGFANEPSPRIAIPTAVGRFRQPGLFDGFPSVYCGQEAMRNRGFSNLIYPVKGGLIDDWDEIEKFWHHIFYKELYVPPETTKVMHVVHPLVPKKDKERLAEILFESFTINALYLGKSPTLALSASGRTSGIVWESGHECSYVAPVFEGFHLRNSTVLSPLNGKIMTTTLQKLLLKLGYSFSTPFDVDILNDIKVLERCMLRGKDYEQELANIAGYADKKVKYKLPDGQYILLGEETFQVAETLFKPQLGGLDCMSLVDTIIASVNLCDLDYRKTFFNNIIFSGGSTMFPGLVERLTQELSIAHKPKFNPKIDALSNRQSAAWIGGSIMSSLSILKDFWLNKTEYEDNGRERVNYKFV